MSSVPRTKKGRRKFDKKNAHRFTLMHRSQLDPLYDEEGASKLVLHPQNDHTAEGHVYAELRRAQDQDLARKRAEAEFADEHGGYAGAQEQHLSAVDENGMPKDGYNYGQHIRQMGGGVFVGVDGKARSTNTLGSNVQAVLATREEDMPKDRMFEAITLTTDDMPEDVALALDSDYDDYDYNDEYNDGNSEGDDAAQGRLINGKDGVFEELQMDFVQVASAEPEDGGASAFNFKEHIARMMRHADGKYSDDEGEEGGEELHYTMEEGEEFDLEALGLSHLVEQNRGAPHSEHDSPEDSTRPYRNIDEAFDSLLDQEYNDSQIGDLDEELCAEDGLAETLSGLKLDADTVGEMMDRFLEQDGQRKVPLTGEALHEQLLHVKEYTEKQQEMLSSELSESALRSLDGGESSELRSQNVLNDETNTGEIDYDADDVPVLHASSKKNSQNTKDVEIGWSREKRFLPRRLRREHEHDCESVVSTYSNLDNHPRLLGATRKDGRTSRAQPADMPFIKLSKKTGMPIGALDRYDDDSSEEESASDAEEADEEDDDSRPKPNLGVKRNKKETREERRARKKAVKAERRARRQQKKMMKTVFKKEEKRQLRGTRPSDGISITPL